jgi:hypothetical protein
MTWKFPQRYLRFVCKTKQTDDQHVHPSTLFVRDIPQEGLLCKFVVRRSDHDDATVSTPVTSTDIWDEEFMIRPTRVSSNGAELTQQLSQSITIGLRSNDEKTSVTFFSCKVLADTIKYRD